MRNFIRKIKSKKGSTDMVVILIVLVIFAAIAGYYVRVVLGDKTQNTGVEGASQRVTDVILNNVP